MASKKTDTALSVYAELSKAGGDVAPNEGEDKTAFLVRMTEAVSALDDAEFDALSALAQKWFNSAGEAINAGTPEKIPSLSGMPEIAEAETPDGEVQPGTQPKEDKETIMKAKSTKKTPENKTASKAKVKDKPPVNKTSAPNKSPVKKTTMKKESSGRPHNDSSYVVAKSDSAKRGFMKEYIAAACSMKKFTRDALTAKVKSSKCDEKRALQYFYWCKRNKVFTPA